MRKELIYVDNSKSMNSHASETATETALTALQSRGWNIQKINTEADIEQFDASLGKAVEGLEGKEKAMVVRSGDGGLYYVVNALDNLRRKSVSAAELPIVFIPTGFINVGKKYYGTDTTVDAIIEAVEGGQRIEVIPQKVVFKKEDDTETRTGLLSVGLGTANALEVYELLRRAYREVRSKGSSKIRLADILGKIGDVKPQIVKATADGREIHDGPAMIVEAFGGSGWLGAKVPGVSSQKDKMSVGVVKANGAVDGNIKLMLMAGAAKMGVWPRSLIDYTSGVTSAGMGGNNILFHQDAEPMERMWDSAEVRKRSEGKIVFQRNQRER